MDRELSELLDALRNEHENVSSLQGRLETLHVHVATSDHPDNTLQGALLANVVTSQRLSAHLATQIEYLDSLLCPSYIAEG